VPADGTDNEIIAEILKGRKEGFTVLVERYQQAAYKMALALLRHPADAEDAASEAFVKAYAALPGCRDGTNFKGWLLKITYNCCQDILRKRAVTGKYAGPDPVDTASGGPGPLDAVIEQEDKQALWSALAELGPEDRSAVVMKYYHGLSYREIAAALNWPMGTVATRLARAREKLHRILKGGGNQ
jgi:RNA polymerase sigma-70 factor (ECF subfamily)